jgi:hypothetical protein
MTDSPARDTALGPFATLLIPLPALNQFLLDSKVIEDSRYHEIHEIQDLLRPVIETRGRR